MQTIWSLRLTRAPIGCQFPQLLSGIAPPELERTLDSPELFYWVGQSLTSASRYRPEYEDYAASLLAKGPSLIHLAEEILQPVSRRWWFDSWSLPQLSAMAPGADSWDPFKPKIPDRHPTWFERGAQMPEWALYTSTEAFGTSSFIAGSRERWADLGPLKLPAPLNRFHPRKDARVFVIDSPMAWHELCLAFPAPVGDGEIVPDFVSASQSWDAIHLPLAGLLATYQVRVDSDRCWTNMREWDCEQTVWLKWAFDDVAPFQSLKK